MLLFVTAHRGRPRSDRCEAGLQERWRSDTRHAPESRIGPVNLRCACSRAWWLSSLAGTEAWPASRAKRRLGRTVFGHVLFGIDRRPAP